MLIFSFDSAFESGNLLRAVRVNTNEYELTTRLDTNAKSHTQWFFFSITGMHPSLVYTFKIVNMEKPTTEFWYLRLLFTVNKCSRGMQPVFLSEISFVLHGEGWKRTGSNATNIFFSLINLCR